MFIVSYRHPLKGLVCASLYIWHIYLLSYGSSISLWNWLQHFLRNSWPVWIYLWVHPLLYFVSGFFLYLSITILRCWACNITDCSNYFRRSSIPLRLRRFFVENVWACECNSSILNEFFIFLKFCLIIYYRNETATI